MSCGNLIFARPDGLLKIPLASSAKPILTPPMPVWRAANGVREGSSEIPLTAVAGAARQPSKAIIKNFLMYVYQNARTCTLR